VYQILANLAYNTVKAGIDGNGITMNNEINGNTSDGYHTFNELYHHRAVLFAALQRAHPDVSWKSKQHSDGTMYDNSFIAGIYTPNGMYTYHCDISEWDMFTCVEIEFAPKWDGHVPSDVDRLLSLELYTPPSVYDGASMTVTS
jgi:hypothetical protein